MDETEKNMDGDKKPAKSNFFKTAANYIASWFHVQFDTANGKENYALSVILRLIIFGSLAVLAYSLCLDKPGENNNLNNIVGGLLVSWAALIIGGLSGFLFGIPRTVQSSKADDSGGENYVSNTNLEQISDWLTKIIVGLGLTQINQIPGQLDALGTQLKPVFGGSDIGWAISITTVLYFLINGFLFGYLWTRIYFKVILQKVNKDLEQQMADVEAKAAQAEEKTAKLKEEADTLKAEVDRLNLEREAAKENKRQRLEEQVAQEIEAQTHQNQLPTEQEQEREMPDSDEFEGARYVPPLPEIKLGEKIGEITNKLDPQKGRFGGSSVDNGLELKASVTDHPSISGLFNVKLWVEPMENSDRQLDSEVIFYLHDTFDPPIDKVMPLNNKAEINLVAWGAFTVGVVTDGGATLLEKDLTELPGAPALFKSR